MNKEIIEQAHIYFVMLFIFATALAAIVMVLFIIYDTFPTSIYYISIGLIIWIGCYLFALWRKKK